MQYGFSYGNAPVPSTFERYDSWQNMTDSQASHSLMPPPPYTTPGPRSERLDRKERKLEKSDKKRKRGHVEDLDLSASKRPMSRGDDTMTDAPANGGNGRVLHSGLTGGLTRLVTDPDFYEDRIDAGPTPISPLKRSKHDKELKDARRKSSYTSYSTTKTASSRQNDDKHINGRSRDRDSTSERHRHRSRRGSSSSPESRHRTTRKEYKAIEYPDRPSSVQPSATNQLVTYTSKAELFMSFITKGPDSERGCSINKALKRYHRERDVRGEEKEDDDKDLWKSLRLRRNDRGEIVLFI
jgi:cell growth-regulating nucleolar protein